VQPPSPERIEWIQTAYHWLEAVPAVGLAVLGGVVRALIARKRRECPLRMLLLDVLVGALTAGFTGFITWLLLESSPIPGGIQAGIVGMAGYSGPQLLQVFSRKLLAGADKCDL
jgi:hypothetical protein